MVFINVSEDGADEVGYVVEQMAFGRNVLIMIELQVVILDESHEKDAGEEEDLEDDKHMTEETGEELGEVAGTFEGIQKKDDVEELVEVGDPGDDHDAQVVEEVQVEENSQKHDVVLSDQIGPQLLDAQGHLLHQGLLFLS